MLVVPKGKVLPLEGPDVWFKVKAPPGQVVLTVGNAHVTIAVLLPIGAVVVILLGQMIDKVVTVSTTITTNGYVTFIFFKTHTA